MRFCMQLLRKCTAFYFYLMVTDMVTHTHTHTRQGIQWRQIYCRIFTWFLTHVRICQSFNSHLHSFSQPKIWNNWCHDQGWDGMIRLLSHHISLGQRKMNAFIRLKSNPLCYDWLFVWGILNMEENWGGHLPSILTYLPVGWTATHAWCWSQVTYHGLPTAAYQLTNHSSNTNLSLFVCLFLPLSVWLNYGPACWCCKFFLIVCNAVECPLTCL